MTRQCLDRADLERISALVDAREPLNELDRQWLEALPERKARYLQYCSVDTLLRGLSMPVPSSDFAERVSGRLRTHERRRAFPMRASLPLAAALLIALGLVLYQQLPQETAPPPTAAQPMVAAAIADNRDQNAETPSDEDDLWVFMAELGPEPGLADNFILFEELPSDALVDLLVDMTRNAYESHLINVPAHFSPSEQDEFLTTEPMPYMTVFDLIETLDEVEAAQLNVALRAALAEA